ncbi:MAG: universal stress protein, partial [Succinivibrio sp.]
MSTIRKFAVLLKPNEEQPALDRAAQYAKVDPSIEVVAVRVINDFDANEKDQITVRETTAFDKLKRSYSSIQNFSFKLIFSKNVADAFVKECDAGDYTLAIVSANRRNTLKDMFVSTIDSSIMRQSTIPLLLVRSAKNTSALGQSVI